MVWFMCEVCVGVMVGVSGEREGWVCVGMCGVCGVSQWREGGCGYVWSVWVSQWREGGCMTVRVEDWDNQEERKVCFNCRTTAE